MKLETKWQSIREKKHIKQDHYLPPYAKINSKHQTFKFLESIVSHLLYLNVRKHLTLKSINYKKLVNFLLNLKFYIHQK